MFIEIQNERVNFADIAKLELDAPRNSKIVTGTVTLKDGSILKEFGRTAQNTARHYKEWLNTKKKVQPIFSE